MEYELSQHAREVLGERKISPAWVEHVLRGPEKIERDPVDAQLEHRLGRISEHGNRVLRVILKPSSGRARVITAYFDRGMKDKL